MRRLTRYAVVALVALLLVAGSAVAFISYRAGDSLVHPLRQPPTATPGDLGLAWGNVTLATEDGLLLNAWWMPADDAPEDDPTVLFLHGYRQSRNQSLKVAPFLHDAGYNVLAFDFRAHSDSEGEYSTVGVLEKRDARAALAWLASRPGVGEDPDVALLGWSMGGAVALLAAPDEPTVDAVVADSAFREVATVAGAGVERYLGLPPWPFGPLAVRFAAWQLGVDVGASAPIRTVGAIERPLLLVHGTADSFIPLAHVHELAAATGGRARVVTFEGADHVESVDGDAEGYATVVVGFLDEAFGR